MTQEDIMMPNLKSQILIETTIPDSCEEKFCQFYYTFYSQSFVKLDNLADLRLLFLKKKLCTSMFLKAL